MNALSGMKVLDLSQFESGPSCAQWLGWYGADVVRVDAPPVPGRQALNALNLANNQNKRSIAIDLRGDEGKDVVHRLAAWADVVVENYAVGVAEKLGVGYEQLKAVNPAIVYCTIKGFGVTGPYRNALAFDPVAQAAGGAMSVTGDADGPPMRSGYVVADNVSGTTAATGVLAAYIHRLRTGEGQLVEISMQEAVLSMMRSSILMAPQPGGPIPRRGNRMTPPTDLYPCAPGGPNDYVQITAPDARLCDRVAAAIGHPAFTSDPRFASAEARRTNGDALWKIVSAWTRQRDKWTAMDELTAAGVPASAVFAGEDLEQNPHLIARDALVRLSHPNRADTTVVANPVRLHATPTTHVASPDPGEHSREILIDVLGMDPRRADEIVSSGAVTGV